MARVWDDAVARVSEAFERSRGYAEAHPYAAAGIGAGVLLGGWVLAGAAAGGRRRDYRRKPATSALSGGGIQREKVQEVYDDYHDAFGKGAGEGIIDRNRTTELVDTFYNLVTDLYEWGWGTSFHFSPLLPGKDWAASEAAHEGRIAAVLGLKSGMKALDVGCGVGGPMRTIASTSGAHVTGITINDYQVKRAKYHNQKLGVAALCEPTQGDFTRMPFAANSFDGAYAIEATCHAAVLQEVYGEIFRVLKPGARFCSYEWVSTKAFDPKNPEHVRIIDEINYGNGLPEMRTYKEAEVAGKAAGFRLVHSYDIATESSVAGPWFSKLAWLRNSNLITLNRALVNLVTLLRVAPKGMKDVHEMLVNVANSLIAGGESGVFSPMHMLVFEKPAEDANDKE